MSEKPAIGIDLGATNSVIAVYREGKVEILANDQGNRSTPSCVAFTETERLVGEGAVHQAHNNPKNTICGVKRLIGREFDDPELQKDMKNLPFAVIEEDEHLKIRVNYKGEMKTVYPEEIAAAILDKMRVTAEAALGSKIKDVVIAIPAYFNNSQREATQIAADIAGLKVVRMINEPTAAAIAYESQLTGFEQRNVLIFDFGGSFNATIVTIKGKDYKVRAIAGDTHLGGENFDDLLVDHFVDEFNQKYNQDIRKDKDLLRHLKAQCEQAKRTLSIQNQTKVQLAGTKLEGEITRARFEDLCYDLFENSIKLVEKVLKDSEMSKEEIYNVILVGGSSRIPKIQQMLQEFFDGKELLKSINPEEVVAHGAAIQAAILQNIYKQENTPETEKSEPPKKSDDAKNEIGIGIDIGASKIVVAVCRGDKAEIFKNSEGSRSTKFCVAFNNNERLFSDAAEGQFPVNPENTVFGRDVKQIIGLRKQDFDKSMTSVSCPLTISEEHDQVKFCIKYRNEDQNLFPEHILTMFLSKIKYELENAYKTKVSKAVITVPSMFNSSQRFAVKNAVLAADIEVQNILNDSTASAITYMIERHGSDDKNILIFDMGTTSTDVAVVQLTGNTVEVKACGGNLNLGGESFVLLLLEHFIREFERVKQVKIRANKQHVTRLRDACEKFKKMLSATSKATYHVENFFDGEPYQLKMERETFESLSQHLCKKVADVVKDVVQASKCKVDEIIVIGNGARIPKIEETISKVFGKEISKVLNTDESVAIGAAYYAARKLSPSCKIKSLNVKQVTATPLKFDLKENGVFTMIRRGKLIPINTETTYQNKNQFQLSISAGEHIFVEGCLPKHEYIISSDFNKDGLLKIILSSEDNPEPDVLVNHQNISDTKIAQIQSTEKMFQKYERKERKVMQMKNELEIACLKYKRKFNSNEMKELLPEEDFNKFETILRDTLDWLDENFHPELHEIQEKIKNIKKECDYFIEKANFLKTIQQAETLLSKKDFHEASSVYGNILTNYSNYLDDKQRFDLMFKRVSALMELEDYQEIIKILDSMKENAVDDATRVKLFRICALCHFELENYKDCIENAEVALSLEECASLRLLVKKAMKQ